LITINSTGIEITTLPENLQRIINEIRAIYPDLIIDQDTPEGQIIGIFAKVESDTDENAVLIINQFDPDKAIGVYLDSISKLAGIVRNPATRSEVILTIVANSAKTLPKGFIVQDENGIDWQLTEDINLIVGTNTAEFECVTLGAINSPIGSISKPSQVYSEIDSYSNISPVIVGEDEESDEDFRYRRQNSTYNPSYTIVGGIESAIADIASVTIARVYENDQDVTDSNEIPPHSMWAIVDGGDNMEIAEVIARRKTVGAGMKGSVEVYYHDINRPNPQNILIKFDRPTIVPLYVKVTVKGKTTGAQIDTELIKQNIATLNYQIGESAVANTIYGSFVNQASNFIAVNLQISRNNSTYTTELIQASVNEKFHIDISNIQVTVQ
jgi:uncharacterized phage protein gp47/JayE